MSVGFSPFGRAATLCVRSAGGRPTTMYPGDDLSESCQYHPARGGDRTSQA